MSIRIQNDAKAPTAAIELTIRHPLPTTTLKRLSTPRDVDSALASQGFHDLIDEARGILGTALRENGLDVVQLTGAICSDGRVHRPGLWLVLREKDAPAGGADVGQGPGKCRRDC